MLSVYDHFSTLYAWLKVHIWRVKSLNLGVLHVCEAESHILITMKELHGDPDSSEHIAVMHRTV